MKKTPMREALDCLKKGAAGHSGFGGETIPDRVFKAFAVQLESVPDVCALPVEIRARVLWLVAAGYHAGERDMHKSCTDAVRGVRP